MEMYEKNFDVVIVGGGLAGLTLACLLGRDGIGVAVIDAADPNKPMIGDERTTAISYGSGLILDEAGVWGRLLSSGAAIKDIQILDGDSPLLLNFLSAEVGGKDFGTIVLNSDIRAVLKNKVDALDCVQLIAPSKVSDFEILPDCGRVILDDGGVITGRLLIGADGRKSFMRDWLDIDVRRWDYRQRAVVCLVNHEYPHNNVAVEHFYADGPFAILPMADDRDGKHRSSVVFTEHGPEAKSLMHLSAATFELALQAKFPARYGEVKMIGERSVYPLGLVHASRYIGPRMALMADAAHGIHPIAGQGLNLGFRDVKEMAALVRAAYKNDQDIGADELLQTYQRRRRPDNVAMIAFTDGLVRLFSNSFPPLRLIRRAGLKAVGKLSAAKRFFMKQAMADRS
ncbi:MAG: ubiquinone biosynthesis protein [Micavibrio sp.]|nr:ubiquinone biosynthesis protein [Micavibrio sp.]